MLETRAYVGLARAAPGRRSTSKAAVRLRPRGRGRCRRWTATRCSSRSASRGRASSTLASPASDLSARVAREVVEFYGDTDHASTRWAPGRSGWPQWRRSSQIVLERNPTYREMLLRRRAARRRRRGPGDRWRASRAGACRWSTGVEVSIIEESQPRWLAFLNGEHDLVIAPAAARVRTLAMPNGKLAPNLAKRGMQLVRIGAGPTSRCCYFNMEDPMVGGYTPEKVALRRAISAGLRRAARDPPSCVQRPGDPAQSLDAAAHHGLRPDVQERDAASTTRPRPKALLDMFGYVDRDGDGWRDCPTARRWCIEYAPGSPTQISPPARRTRVASEPDRASACASSVHDPAVAGAAEGRHAGKLHDVVAGPVGRRALTVQDAHCSASTAAADRRAEPRALQAAPAFDAHLRAHDRSMPDGPERGQLFRERAAPVRRVQAVPLHRHRVTDMCNPWLIGYRRPMFWHDWWQYVDIDTSDAQPNEDAIEPRSPPAPPPLLAPDWRSPPRRGRAAGRPAARKVLALRLRVAETGFDPATGQRPVLAHRHRHIFEAPLRLRLPGAAGQGCGR